uniref:Uncharacterized protein n=2 Tax=Oryza TaxID=4527 RepID=A0A0E0MZS1_ORYRU
MLRPTGRCGRVGRASVSASADPPLAPPTPVVAGDAPLPPPIHHRCPCFTEACRAYPPPTLLHPLTPLPPSFFFLNFGAGPPPRRTGCLLRHGLEYRKEYDAGRQQHQPKKEDIHDT